MPPETQIIRIEAQLERIPGKGGWTYFLIPKEIAATLGRPFGYIQVSGTVDGFAFTHHNIMPYVKDHYFFPVREEIRKAIGKEAGDRVNALLWLETGPLPLPDDLVEALEISPEAKAFFDGLTDANKRYYLKWLDEAKQPATRQRRVVETVLRLERGLKYGEKS